MNEVYETIENFSPGNINKPAPSQIPLGAGFSGQNVVINDGDRIAPRKGQLLLDTVGETSAPVTSSKNFKLSDGTEIPVVSCGTGLYYYSPDTESFELLKDDYTDGQPFGFTNFNDNVQQEDQLALCNGIEPYAIWNGITTKLDGGTTSGDTEIVVDSVLKEFVDESVDGGSVSASTTTSITLSLNLWSTDLWNDFYVRITDGAQAGKISKITDTTANSITFNAISGLSGTPSFQIKRAAFKDSGTIIVDGAEVTYTSLDQDNRFAGCTGTPTAADEAAVAQAITEYPANPRGNIMVSVDGYIQIAEYESTVLRRSALGDATDFTFSATRLAGEGDLNDFVEGGGPIKGLAVQESLVYVSKEDVWKTITYTQDGDDRAVFDTIVDSPLVGAANYSGVFKARNFVFYMSPLAGPKSLGRVADLQNTVSTADIGDPILPDVKSYTYDESAGIFYDNKAYFSAKQSGSLRNDIVRTYNFAKQSWEFPLEGINARCFFIFNDKLYYGSSAENKVIQLERDEYVDTVVDADSDTPYTAEWTSGNLNFGLRAEQKEASSMYVEGFISAKTSLNIALNYEYNGYEGSVSTTIRGDDESITFLPAEGGGLGTSPLGVEPLGSGTFGAEEQLRFFRVHLGTPPRKFYEVSVTFSSDGEGQIWEIISFGLNATQVNQKTNINKTKKLS